MKRIILSVQGILFFFCCFGQVQVLPSVLNTAGLSLQNDQIQLDFSIGEMSIATFTGATNTIQSGFLRSQIAVSALPLSFLSFTAILSGNDTRLNWQTANEQNVHGFNVQRSPNGLDFKNIAFIAAANKASNNYEYIDVYTKNLIDSTLFYRLQEIDKDAHSNYSPIRKVSLKNAINYTVFPNPIIDKLEITFNNQSYLYVEKYFVIYNPDGKKILSNRTTLSKVEINTSAWLKGIYIIYIIINEQHLSQIIIKE